MKELEEVVTYYAAKENRNVHEEKGQEASEEVTNEETLYQLQYVYADVWIVVFGETNLLTTSPNRSDATLFKGGNWLDTFLVDKAHQKLRAHAVCRFREVEHIASMDRRADH